MSLVFIGGAIGGGIGLVATFHSLKVFRSTASSASKFAHVGIVSVAAFVGWYALSLLVVPVIYSLFQR